MSPVRLNGSTSGYSELSAPAVAGNNSIALPTGNGSAYQVLRNGATAGSLEYADKITSGTAVASTSGTSIDFTGIPSWVKRVTVMFNGVSTNGTSVPLIQFGTSGGVQNTGYLCSASTGSGAGTSNALYTTGFGLVGAASAAANIFQGSIVLTLLDAASGVWSVMGLTGGSNAAFVTMTSGAKTLSGTLDRVRITTVNGTDTFDAGSINILYE